MYIYIAKPPGMDLNKYFTNYNSVYFNKLELIICATITHL